MDEENNDINRFNTILGVEEDKSAGSKIKSFVKKLSKVPERREVPITYRADFRKTNRELNRNLKKWDALAQRKTSGSIARYLFGNKHRVTATKKLFAELEKTARKSSQKYNNILNNALGEDRNKNKGNPFNYGGEIGKIKTGHDENMKSRKKLQEDINALTEEYNVLLAKQDKIGLNTQEAGIISKMEEARKKLQELEKERDNVSSKAFDNVQPMKIMDTDSKVVMERNKELSKLAAGLYDRSGKQDESLFKILEKELAASMKVDQAALDKVKAELKSMYGKKGGLSSQLSKLEKQPQTEETNNAIAEIKSQIAKAEATIKKLTRDRKIAEGYVDLDKKQQGQFKHYYDNKDKPQDFGQDKNYKTEEFAPKFDAMMRKKTSAIKEMVDSIGALGSPKLLTDINKDIDSTYDAISKLQIKLQEVSAKNSENTSSVSNDDTEENITEQIKLKKQAIDTATKALEKEKQEGKELVNVFGKIANEARNASRELRLLQGDMQIDPINVQLESSDLKKYNDLAGDIKNKVIGIGRNWKKSNVITRLAARILLNIRSQIADMINPLTLFRKGWDAWINRFENLPWKNTFEVIGYNLVSAFAPIFEWFAKALIKVAQVLNVFIMRWTGINLFDKSAWQMEKMKKSANQLTASFDELHSSNENPNQFNTIFDTDPMAISPLSEKTVETLTKIADGIKKAWDATVGFIEEHPIASAILGGAALLLGPKALGGLVAGAGKLLVKGIGAVGKGIWNGVKWLGPKIWNGVKWTAGKITDPNTWKSVGGFFKTTASKIGGFFGKELYTGAGAWGTKAGVTVGKALGGAAMTAVGTYGAFKIAGEAGRNWQDMSTGMKAASVAGVGLGSAMAGVGAVMLGASGPVGWAIGGAVALGSFVYGMSQAQDGIKSHKKELKSWQEAQENLSVANENWNNAMYNSTNALAQLEEMERLTGLSGETLFRSVQNGTVQVNELSSAELQVYNAYVQAKEATDQLAAATREKEKAEKAEAEGMIKTALAARKKKDDYTDAKDAILQAVAEEKISTEEAADYFSRLMGNMKKDAREALMEEIPEDIRQCVEPTKYASGWEKFGNGWNKFWGGLWDGTKKVFKGIGSTIGKAWDGVKKGTSKAWNKIKTGLGGTWNKIKTGVSGAWEKIKTGTSETWEKLKEGGAKTWEKIKTGASTAWDNIKTNTTTAWENIKTGLSGTWEKIKTGASNTWENMKTNASTAWENIKNGASTAWENIKNSAIGQKVQEIATNVSTKWEEIKTSTSEKFQNVRDKAAEKWEEIKNSAIGQKLQEIGNNVATKWEEIKTTTSEKFQGIWDKAKEKWESIKGTITEKASTAWENAKNKWEELKTTTATLFGDILTNTQDKFSEIATTIGDKAKEAFDKAKEWFEGIKTKAKEAWNSVQNWGSNIGNAWNQGDGFFQKVGNAGAAMFGKQFNSYDVGTNYVPNDQLALIHKGEAVIPAKYNKPYTPSNNSGLDSTVAAMTQEIANLRGLIQGGIPVKGEFKQRGSDLVAVVEKGKNRNGNSALSNAAYAR